MYTTEHLSVRNTLTCWLHAMLHMEEVTLTHFQCICIKVRTHTHLVDKAEISNHIFVNKVSRLLEETH